MSIIIFGKDDLIALPKLKPFATSLGSDCLYSNPSYKRCYSKYGFAIPTNYEGIYLDLIMDDKLPKGNDHVPDFSSGLAYLIVDHNSNIWSSLIPSLSKDRTLAHAYVSPDMGWWIGGSVQTNTPASNKLLGFLSMDPTIEQIDQFIFESQAGAALEWMKISDIVATLHKDFPNG